MTFNCIILSPYSDIGKNKFVRQILFGEHQIIWTSKVTLDAIQR